KIEKDIGSGNRFLLWHRDMDSPVIAGEDRGLWHKGRWYSNTYAWSSPRPAYTSQHLGHYYGKVEFAAD
ncbi:MAG TPA: hypothetical protein VKT80_06010, partial [Chloroflexota bacterium]|nr:hypothetical protein [Chloroflexota bacterium]